MNGAEWAAIITALCGAIVSVATIVASTVIQYVKLKEHVKEATEHADTAYAEANGFNRKLSAVVEAQAEKERV